MQSSRVLVAVASVAAAAGCTPYDPALGAMPFYCGSAEPRCPDGYTCMAVAAGSAVCTNGSAGSGSGSGSSMPGTCTAFSGVLATWNLASETGAQISTPAASTETGVTASPIARSAALAASAGAGSISASGWPTSTQLDPAAYFTVSLTPPSGCTLAVTTVAIDLKSSSTGPASASIGTSAAAFAQPTPVSTSAPATVSVSTAAQTGMLELRIFGYAASANTGTMRVQNSLVVSGTLH